MFETLDTFLCGVSQRISDRTQDWIGLDGLHLAPVFICVCSFVYAYEKRPYPMCFSLVAVWAIWGDIRRVRRELAKHPNTMNPGACVGKLFRPLYALFGALLGTVDAVTLHVDSAELAYVSMICAFYFWTVTPKPPGISKVRKLANLLSFQLIPMPSPTTGV